MGNFKTRREFLQWTAAGVCVAGMGGASLSAAQLGREAGVLAASVHVITGPASTGGGRRSRTWGYIGEIFERAGVFYETHEPSDLKHAISRPGSILVLVGSIPLNADQRSTIADWVKRGGCLLGIGASSGLAEVFGIVGEMTLSEGWIKPGKAHAITAGLRSSLHVFGGVAVKKAASATVVAGIQGGGPYLKGDSIVENRYGKGYAVLIGPDVVFSIVHMQQGVPVLQDGRAAGDNFSAINDGVLKAEDGSVLDWERDRSDASPEGRIFLEPVSDELREVLLRSVFHLARQQGSTLPVLWQWPRALKAVAMMSHDSDGNEPGKAVALLDVLKRCEVKTTWCILYPGGYPREFYGKLQDGGYEIALHYDAMTGAAKTSWSKENFLFQRKWLLEQAGIRHVTTNKNHYTRWEGRLDFWRWCEEAGIGADQTRGPSKKGTIGFPLGGSQPYFPIDDESERVRRMEVLEVNLMTQDLIVTCPQEYGRQLLESAVRHNGVAHFLFHPAHIQKPGVADALANLVEAARGAGIEWWTSAQILHWETQRRRARLRIADGGRLKLKGLNSLQDAMLLFLKPGGEAGRLAINGKAATGETWNLYGFEFEPYRPGAESDIRVSWNA